MLRPCTSSLRTECGWCDLLPQRRRAATVAAPDRPPVPNMNLIGPVLGHGFAHRHLWSACHHKAFHAERTELQLMQKGTQFGEDGGHFGDGSAQHDVNGVNGGVKTCHAAAQKSTS